MPMVTRYSFRDAKSYARWSTRLLADRFVALGHVEALSHETVRRALKKARCGPG